MFFLRSEAGASQATEGSHVMAVQSRDTRRRVKAHAYVVFIGLETGAVPLWQVQSAPLSEHDN